MGVANTAFVAPVDKDLVRYDPAPANTVFAGTSGDNVASLKPYRNGDDSLNAIAARRAGRLNAASVKDKEVDALLAERQSLIAKKFGEGLTRAEGRRLALVRWNLDRIQDARHGETLDELESAVTLYENIGAEIAHLVQELQSFTANGTRR